MAFELSAQKTELLEASGHILVLGGPGSGKTTIALLKAQRIIERGLIDGQKVLFLSFARATIARVEEQASDIISKRTRKQVEINTYHGFTWNLLKSHGYLLNNRATSLKLLPPPEAAARLVAFESETEREAEKFRLFYEDGLLHFDLFSKKAAKLLSQSKALSNIVCNAYPVIILDEFQDTNQSEWDFIQQLGKKSRLIALADLDQRIYGFRGADPARISQFIAMYRPNEYDFGAENHRSTGTDIIEFGNDLLTGRNIGRSYNNVTCLRYGYYKNSLHLDLKVKVIQSIKKLSRGEDNTWSLAVLFPTKSLMTQVSDFLSAKQVNGRLKLPSIQHDILLEMAGPSLSAIAIAKLLGKERGNKGLHLNFLGSLYDHIRGRNGDKGVSKAQLILSDAIKVYIETGSVRGKNRQLLISESARICEESSNLVLTGDPVNDWLSVRALLLAADCPEIAKMGEDAKFLRLLRKGAILSSGLSQLWRSTDGYNGASSLISNALLQEHFSASNKPWRGVNLMTIHAAKGKQFNEVIIYDGPHQYRDKILRDGASQREIDEMRLTLRVGVTRAMSQAIILTPGHNPCRLVFQSQSL